MTDHVELGWVVVVKGKATNSVAEIFGIITALRTEIVYHVVVAVLFIKEFFDIVEAVPI